MRRHIDFIAVFFIAVVMAGFSQAASWKLPDAADSVRLQKAANVQSCPISREVLASLADILNQ